MIGDGASRIALTACVEGGRHDCCVEESCRVKPQMGQVNGLVRGALAGVSLASLTTPALMTEGAD